MVKCEYSGCGGEPSYADFKNASKWPCCGKVVNLRLNFPAAPKPTPEPVVAPAPAKKKAAPKKTKKSKKK
tara:strand:+ start:332 stop:541 length:210 start_codon:yes stop_codon:yes gene_type:complete